MKKIVVLLLAGLMMFALTACQKETDAKAETTEEKIRITHGLGTVDVPLSPKNVAVLDLAVLDVMDALGLKEHVAGIPKSSSVSYLKSYTEEETIADMGSVKEVDMEALNSIQPDLIIIGGRLAAEYENLSKIAPTVLVKVDHAKGYMESFTKNVEQLAQIFEKTEEAQALLAGFETRIETLKTAANGSSAVVSLVTSGSVNTLGSGSRCSLITNEIGFTNLATDVETTHGDTASFELLLEKNPEYIFVLDRDTAINAEGATLAKDVIENELVKKTTAYEKGNIVYLTPDVWYLSEGGITATDQMLQDIENGILSLK